MLCPYCLKDTASKNGFSQKRIQRYRCSICLRTHTERLDTRRVPNALADVVAGLAQQGCSVRKIAKQLGYGRSAIWNNLRRAN